MKDTEIKLCMLTTGGKKNLEKKRKEKVASNVYSF